VAFVTCIDRATSSSSSSGRAGTARRAVGAASTKTRISVRQRSHRSAASLLNDAATKAAMYTFKLLTFLLTTHAVDRLRR